MRDVNKELQGEYFDISEKILKLSGEGEDRLSEDIILENIRQQLEGRLEIFKEKINYLSLFKDKYAKITPENSFYDKNYIQDSLERVSTLTGSLLESRYGVKLGKDIDYYAPEEYLNDMEKIYEFFFIRHFRNLADYFYFELQKNRSEIIGRYEKLFQQDAHNKDIFVQQAKKKFKNIEDVMVMHFINDILDDIFNSQSSGYVLFDRIANLDPYEETNTHIINLMQNYGSGLMMNGDKECYDLYMSPLKQTDIKNELKNSVFMRYLETCEIEETL
jgi:hypothetical protein